MAVISPRRHLWMAPACGVLMSVVVSCAPIQPNGVPGRDRWAIPSGADPATNPQEFLTFARSAERGWGGGDRQYRNCRGCPAGTYTDVQVDAVAGLKSYDPPPARSGSALVARFINRGSETEEKYGLRGRSLAPHYLVLDPGDGSDRVRWRVWSEQGNTVVPGDSGWFRLCHKWKAEHPGAPPDRRAKFLDCDRTLDTPGGGESAGPLLNSRTADVWLECGRAGCCSASVT